MIKKILIATALVAASGLTIAQEKGDGNGFVLSALASGDGITPAQMDGVAGPTPPTNAQLTNETPQGNVQSWDGEGAPDNCVISVSLPVGLEVIGASWDVRIETVGASWLSEMTYGFRVEDETLGINLAPGTGDDMAGEADYTSGGVLFFADVPLPNMVIGSDGLFTIEVFEDFDDDAGLVDADVFNLPVGGDFGLTFACDDQAACDAAFADPGAYTTSGSCADWEFAQGGGGGEIPESQPVPVNNLWALGLLALLLTGFGLFIIRRMG